MSTAACARYAILYSAKKQFDPTSKASPAEGLAFSRDSSLLPSDAVYFPYSLCILYVMESMMSLSSMPLKSWLPLLGLTVSAFIFNSSEFMPIGLLTDIAHTFRLTEAQAGMLMVWYAWAVMILSLPLMILVSRMEFKKLLLSVVALFGLCQMFSAAAPNFEILLAARIGVACTHAIFWSITPPLAVRIVAESHKALALSAVVTGTSIAMIFGLPMGRMLGLYLGWRMPFACVGIVAFLVCLYLFFVFPKVPPAGSFSVKELPALFKNPALTGIYVLTFLTSSAYYTGYSYIEPFLQQTALLSDGWITFCLMLFGAAGIIGSFLFSQLYSRHRYAFVRFVIMAMAAVLLLLLPSAASLYTSILLCALWGIAATAYCVTFQAETIRAVTMAESAIAMSMYSGIFNLGIGFGTWVGGLVTTYASIDDIGIAGGIIGIIASLYCCAILIKALKINEILQYRRRRDIAKI